MAAIWRLLRRRHETEQALAGVRDKVRRREIQREMARAWHQRLDAASADVGLAAYWRLQQGWQEVLQDAALAAWLPDHLSLSYGEGLVLARR